MPVVNGETKETHCKIVYYGPSLSGKTTNLVFIHGRLPDGAKGELLTLSTESDNKVSFDFLPLDMGTIHGYKVRFHLYTVPGPPSHELTRKELLDGVDGIVFVADSGRSRFNDNIQSYYEMRQVLSIAGKSVDEIPLVMQFNKRDLADAVPIPILNARLNSSNSPYFLATAKKGVGVLATLREISRLVVARLE